MPGATNTQAPAPAADRGRRAWLRFAIGLALVQVVNLACAILITRLALTPGTLGINLVYSACIGTFAYSCINGGRILLWGDGARPPLLPFIFLMLGGLLAGQVAGSVLAGWMTGVPVSARQLAVEGHGAELALLTLAAGLLASWLFWNRGKLAYLAAAAEMEKARAAAIQEQALQAQLKLLQAQIEPHMLFNTLANLQGLIAIDPARAQALLDQLIQYLRSTLSSSRTGSTTLGQEFALVEAYLGLMAVRMGPRLRYTLDLPAALAALPIAPMLLQPLVENALRHGLEPQVEGGTVNVSARVADGSLHIVVSDSGAGVHACGTAGTGLGLANIGERLAALHGAAARLELEPNLPGGMIARLVLPLPHVLPHARPQALP